MIVYVTKVYLAVQAKCYLLLQKRVQMLQWRRFIHYRSNIAGNTTVAQTLLNAYLNNVENVNPLGMGLDAFAIAPFFGNFITTASSVDDALNQAETSLSIAYQSMNNHRDLLSGQGWNIPLINYEGGTRLRLDKILKI
ncbi:MAG: hypothetical protein Q7T20_18020 [Saprospiraceae bacterium]|nr:hypothetical protein [Saprospiraceae bacterium]